MSPRSRIGSVAADCADLERMVTFWSSALEYRVLSSGLNWAYLVDPKR
jgi:hypothetical protein